MKIIDLLNKIANGEEVPKKIIYDGYIWEYDKLSNDYEEFDESGDLYLFGDLFSEKYVTLALNDEVEIIEEEKKDNFTGWKIYQDGREVCSMDCSQEEEKKIPEKINVWYEFNATYDKELTKIMLDELKDKYNEIIDYLKKENK